MLFAQQKPEYTIGILVDFRASDVAPLLEKLTSEIEAVVGQDADLRFPSEYILANNYNLEVAREQYQTLINNDTDIILAFGVVNNEVITKLSEHQKPTILFGAVNRDVTGIDITKTNSGIENFTYLVESESFEEDLKTFQELSSFKNIGIAVDAPFLDILPLEEVFNKEVPPLGADYKMIPFRSVDDILNNLDEIDAIYMAGGFFLDEAENTQLAKAFIERKLPSFTVNGVDDVRVGLMATNQSSDNLDQFFRRIALNIEAYINGTPLEDLPIYIDYTPRLTVNYNTMESIGVPIKYSLINDTDFVGEFINVLSEKRYTLLTTIDDALNNNLNLQSSQKDVELSNQDVKSAVSNYIPSVTASGTGTYIDPDLAEVSNGQNPEFSTTGNITLQQTIFSEAANANISIQKSLLKAQEANFNATELDLIFDAANVYFNALILKANLQIQSRNLDLTKRNLEIATQNFEAGQAGKSDVLRFRSQMAQNTQSMVEAVNQLEQGFISFNQVLNNPTGMEIDVEDVDMDDEIFSEYNYDQLVSLLDDSTLRDPFIEFLIEEAYKNAPELRVLDYNLEATDRNVKLNSYGRLLPTLALQGQYNRTFSRSGVGSVAPVGFPQVDSNYNLGLSLSIPIINQNLTNINRQTAIIQKEQLEINKENTTLAISANVRNGVLGLVNQLSNISLSQVSEEAAKEALDLTQTSYSSGAVNIVQLLDAQTNYLNAQLARTNAVYNFLLNALQLERFLGYYFLLNSEEDNNAFRQRFFEFLNNRN